MGSSLLLPLMLAMAWNRVSSFFRFQEKAHAFWRALDVTRKRNQERLQVQFTFVGMVNVRALKGLAGQLNGEGLVLV